MNLTCKKVLIVCTGNICRSPMGEWFMRERLSPERGHRVESAGIGALVGHGADEKAIAVMDELGYDLRAHRARQLDLALAREFELLLVMESGHQAWIESTFPALRGRIFRMGHWQGRDVPDPYRRPEAEFRAARDLIREAADSWLDVIHPTTTTTT
jgi:protein-tyrosine phosphatase